MDDRRSAEGTAGSGLLARFAETLRSDSADLSAARLAATVVARPGPDDRPPQLGEPSVASELARRGHAIPVEAAARFESTGLIGAGATAAVYAFADRDLRREVAVKVLAGAADAAAFEAFLAEARVTASLQHPNVPPVHDVGVAADDRLFFVMKRIVGRSLADALVDSTLERRAPPVASLNDLVNVVIAVGNALAFAHHHGLIHQDVKPANILLGGFGEVLLADWGSAVRIGDPRGRLYGTPLYMSPEQAMNRRADVRSDVYCLGASLFHALTLRPPTMVDDEAEFWRRKRAGEIDPLPEATRRAVPPELLGIAYKALAPDPGRRYADIAALLADLRAYQAGQSISAHRESAWQRLRRWHRRNARALWASLAFAAVLAALALQVYGDRRKDSSGWGEPIITGPFTAIGPGSPWLAVNGGFRVEGGRVVSTCESANVLLLDRRLEGGVAVEYDAEILPGAAPGDVSVVFGSGVDRDAFGNAVWGMRDSNYLLVGTWDDTGCKILGDEDQVLATSPVRLGAGRHRVRAEFLDDSLALWLDGRLVCRAEQDRFDRSGYIALYGFYEGKAYGDVKVWARGLPQRTPATAIGDAFLRHAPPDADTACAQYRRVIDSSPGSPLAEEATYKLGLAHQAAGRRAEAEAAWTRLSDPVWRLRADGRRVRIACADGDFAAAARGLDALVDAGHPEAAARAWVLPMMTLLPYDRPAELRARWLDLRRPECAGMPGVRVTVARALMQLGRFDEVARDYADLLPEAPQALLAAGRNAELLERYPSPPSVACQALMRLGRFGEAIERFPALSRLNCQALIASGRAEEALRRFGDRPVLRGAALVALGRLDEAIADRGSEAACLALSLSGRGGQALAEVGAWSRFPATLALRRYDEIERDFHDPSERDWGRTGRLLLGFAAGDRSALAGLEAIRLFDELQDQPCFHVDVLIPFLRFLAGDADGCRARLARVVAERHDVACQRTWHFAALLTGRIDLAAFVHQPYQAVIDGDTALAQAMAAELAGHRAAAREAYAVFARVPPWRRSVGCDPVVDDFVAWRSAALAGR